MLVLTRKNDEAIVITVPGRPNPIRVVLHDMIRGRGRVAVEADRDILIFREELVRTESNDAESHQ